MTSFWGANTELLRDFASTVSDRAGDLGRIRADIGGTVATAAWEGPDAESFRSDWVRTSSTMGQVEEKLRARSEELIRHADEQDRASSPDGDGTGDGAESSQPWWKRMMDFGRGLWDRLPIQELTSIFKGASALLHELGNLRNLRGIWKAWTEGGAEKWAEYVYKHTVGKTYSALWDWTKKGLNLATGGLSGKILSVLDNKLGKSILGRVFGGAKTFMENVGKASSAIAEGVSTMEDVAGRFGTWATRFGKFANFVGKAVPGLDILTGGFGLFNAIKDGDTYGAIANGLVTAGGVVEAIGLACDGTVFGAPVGVVLNVVGGVLVVGGLGMELGRDIYRNWDKITTGVKDSATWIKDRGADAVDAAKDGYRAVSSKAHEVADDIGNGAKSTIEHVSSGVGKAMDWAFG
ncbi:hypothetical protein I8D64_00465 [Brachybacterium sp. MASK1Z-5]|uniref:WXG100 family type VII secretion target n=1 Tax=Brachybacterium halotolerans TaxID=2795215 RepID=A0ABS1B5I0_9MICO|nr:hypothetical protein [Brachybacterium halotolerans]MBK0329879.1 hypothetical protein [Brachybacterium halotolerans]